MFSGEFLRAWAFLLEYIESAALCQNAEVSLAALKSFHEILNIPAMSDGSDESLISESNKSSDELKALFSSRHEIHESFAKSAGNGGVEESALWSQAWRVWRSIGTAVTNLPDPATGVLPNYIPSQAFLTTLVATFPSLFVHIRNQFVAAELQRLFIILQRALVVPVPTSSMSFFLMPVSNNSDSPGLMPLHDSVLGAAKVIIKVGSMSMIRDNPGIKWHIMVTVVTCIPTWLLVFQLPLLSCSHRKARGVGIAVWTFAQLRVCRCVHCMQPARVVGAHFVLYLQL